MSLHVAMNIPDKRQVYAEARRVVRPGGIFAVYDILQGDGGEVSYPVPWAADPALSHLVTPDDMAALLSAAGFAILAVHDSSEESHAALKAAAARPAAEGYADQASPTQLLFGDSLAEMASIQLRGLAERRIRTVSYICRA
jgi:ubiquinone/menaquinone biosynthesis C-methylase UbiE